jgi:hypothetical protein
MRAGRDPRRRNRNIGAAKQGHGQDNRMVIPEPWADRRVFYERATARNQVLAGYEETLPTKHPPFKHPGGEADRSSRFTPARLMPVGTI